jgi:hypothetical protein
VAIEEGFVSRKSLEKAGVVTTVMEKNLSHPILMRNSIRLLANVALHDRMIIF